MNDSDTMNEATPCEMVGGAIRQWARDTMGREPTQEEFERMYDAWFDEASAIYDL